MSATPNPKSRTTARTAMAVGGAVVVAAALAVLVVLPYEYGVDPTGFGRLTGLTRTSTPEEVTVETRMTAPPEVARIYDEPYSSDTVTIEIPPFAENYGQLEYKISMNTGDAVVYSWTASAPVTFEFHGHTVEEETGEPIEVMNYVADEDTSSSGTLVAPIDGIHGWYFANGNFDEPVEIELSLSGYYTLEPGVMALER